jgi:hypothetical protein
MKTNDKMMLVFLMLLIGSSLQFKISNNLEDHAIQTSTDSSIDQANMEVSPKSANMNDPSVGISENDGPNGEDTSKSLPSTKLYNKATKWNSGEKPINYLDRHEVNCNESNSAINSFAFERGNPGKKKNQVRFNYSCVKSRAISNNCKLHQTPMGFVAFMVKNALDSLVGHYVECPKGTVMKSFHLKNKGKFWTGISAFFRMSENNRPKIWYSYKCCKAKISRTIYTQTRRSINFDNEYYNLSGQPINARDLNAISSFDMQAPKNVIFYNIKVSVLKGETSPYFPHPCSSESEKSSQSFNTPSDTFADFSDFSFTGKEFIFNYLILELKARTAKSMSKYKNKHRNLSKVFLGKYLYNN